MTSTSNAYCAALGIRVPRLEDASESSPDANYYSLLVVALWAHWWAHWHGLRQSLLISLVAGDFASTSGTIRSSAPCTG